MMGTDRKLTGLPRVLRRSGAHLITCNTQGSGKPRKGADVVRSGFARDDQPKANVVLAMDGEVTVAQG